jgi:hypothetical protein
MRATAEHLATGAATSEMPTMMAPWIVLVTLRAGCHGNSSSTPADVHARSAQCAACVRVSWSSEARRRALLVRRQQYAAAISKNGRVVRALTSQRPS